MSLLEINNYKYIIDTSAILSQKITENYRKDVYVSLWEKIEKLIQDHLIVTCREIADEVKDEDLQDWLNDTDIVIIPTDIEIQENVKTVVNINPDLVDIHNNKSSGDAFLIATAMKYGLTVITLENKKSPKKIPYTCSMLRINCIDLLQLCVSEKWRM